LAGVSCCFKAATLIAITGADFSAQINDKKIGLNTVIPVQAGDVLSFGKRQWGCRTYLAVKGGLLTPQILGSRSFYKGITTGAIIRKGQELPYVLYEQGFSIRHAAVRIDAHRFANQQLLCSKGPEFDLLSGRQQQQAISSVFTLSNDNNRMGIRLNELIENNLPSMLTSAVLPGTVQLTPSGTLMVLMRDAQVTGGYPRVLQLTEAAIASLAQKVAGEEVRFALV
jgi:allophanate hydrolase subunit 2